ncbi:S8 family serine peptidase [Virgibacillus halophilus]|uniref:S8 family serine peptidase n=1 Tax=Tigheibacillus halophilus TaxID=361280 RepID=UPI0036361413
MKRKRQKQMKAFSMVASMLMAVSLITPVSAQSLSKQDTTNNKISRSLAESKNVLKAKLSSNLMDEFKKKDKVTFLVKFNEKADVKKAAKNAQETASKTKLSAQKTEFIQRSAVVSELKSTSLDTQQNVMKYVKEQKKKGSVKEFESYYIVNGMAVTATKEVAEKIAAFSEVEKILPNENRQLFAKSSTAVKPAEKTAKKSAVSKTDKQNKTKADDNVEWNVDRVGAPAVWNTGIDGTGTVVASIDTGVQWDHPALKEKYRGYDTTTGEIDNDFNWYDATAGQTEPYDDLGHGTHVTGTMTGSEPDGSNQVGVAPGAKWIAVKAFTDAGGTDADLLDAAQWILAPTDADGNERVDMAPDVVNNSWGGGPGLDEWYRDVVKAWRAANIFPAFAAGNVDLFNPGGPGSVASPSNYPESFAVGATDKNDKVASFSLRGPSPYDEIKPDIAAPGSGIRSSVPGSGYAGNSGTSMATPAVSGVVALLHQANASMTVDEIEEVLTTTAAAKTDSEYPDSPNNGYGYGLVNAYDAVNSITEGLGTIQGKVAKEGDDNDAPTFEHDAVKESYAGMNLDLTVQAKDNVSVESVVLHYKTDNEWQSVEATRSSGDYKEGEYTASIPGEDIAKGELVYKWTITDYGNNEVTSDEYTVQILSGITTGYQEDFESKPTGWNSYGEKDSWEWGVPTSGPEEASSGDKVYATNLAGMYEGSMNASLEMPPIDLPEGNAYLQFKQWFEFEKYDSGSAYDFGHVFISTDQENWEQLLRVEGASDGWESAEVNLSEYSGQRVYIAFNATSDSSVNKQGWYLDDVVLSDKANAASKSKTANKASDIKASLGVAKQSTAKKPSVDPDKIKPNMEKVNKKDEKKDKIAPLELPLAATVSVLESGRSVNTDPADGSYALLHAAGDFTLKAEAYGYESAEKSIQVVNDETAEANFTLNELEKATVSGKITDESTGDGIEGAKIIVKEDANVAPVESDADGSYAITAYQGDYTLQILAKGYKSKEVKVDLAKDTSVNVELEPFYTIPGGEIGYDDGTAENARAFYDAGNGWAVKMSLPEGKEKAVVTDGVFRFWDTEWPVPGGEDFAVEVWDASGKDGTPGKKLAGPIDGKALRNGEWTVIDLSDQGIVVDGDFYMVYIQSKADPNAPGLATDEDGPNAKRSMQYVDGTWSPSPAEEGNYMIRARVSYEVEKPEITSPENGQVTSEKTVSVEGKASPTTTVELVGKDDETVGSAEVGDDGKFAIDADLSEGENTFKAISKLDGKNVGESDTVTIIRDTQAPELSIDSPKNNEKTNRETVTVEGTVADANLDFVKVDGKKVDVKDGKYSKRLLLDNGMNTIKVVAKDLAGNKTTKKVTIDAKYTAPEINNVTPTEDKYIEAGETVEISFESEENLKASFAIHMPLTNVKSNVANTTELPVMETSPGHYVGYWTATKSVKADGAEIEVKVKDAYENQATQKAKGKLFINVEK